MVGTLRLDVLFPAEEERLGCEQLREDASDRPHVDRLPFITSLLIVNSFTF